MHDPEIAYENDGSAWFIWAGMYFAAAFEDIFGFVEILGEESCFELKERPRTVGDLVAIDF